MTWNYRIIKENNCYSVCEVFYDENGTPHSWSEPITIVGKDKEDVLEQLEMIIKDINNINNDILEVKNNTLASKE